MRNIEIPYAREHDFLHHVRHGLVDGLLMWERDRVGRSVYEPFNEASISLDRSAQIMIWRGLVPLLLDKLCRLTKDGQIRKLIEDTRITYNSAEEDDKKRIAQIDKLSHDCAAARSADESPTNTDILEVLLAIILASHWQEIADEAWSAIVTWDSTRLHSNSICEAWQRRGTPGETSQLLQQTGSARVMIEQQIRSSTETIRRIDMAWMEAAVVAINHTVNVVGSVVSENILRGHNLENLEDIPHGLTREATDREMCSAAIRARRDFTKRITARLVELAKSQSGESGEPILIIDLPA